jgi:archaellum component FlaF (FlaF/FlaG flagellin family)
LLRAKKSAVSTVVLILVIALVIASALAVYFATFRSTVAPTENLGNSNTSNVNNNNISIQAISVASSTSNLTATVNVSNSSALTRMSLFINGTYVGSYNYTQNGWGYECFRWMRAWSNGTSSFYFTATPYWMPMMGNWNWGFYGGMMGGGMYYHRSYMVTIMATFADGSRSNASVTIVPNQQGTGWECWLR